MKAHLSILVVAAVALCTIAASPLPEKSVKISAGEKSIQKQNAGFSFFRTHRQGKYGATSTWGMTTESGVAGFIVQRTYEDPADPYAWWEDVSAMPCNGSRSYKCTDEGIFPGYISYRIVALFNNGGSITSEVNTIRIVSH
jgi:hypothetical protein